MIWILRGALVLNLGLVGCAGPAVQQYAAATPRLYLDQYFNGCVVGWGMIKDWSDDVVSRFKVNIQGSLDPDGTLVLDENFLYDDGSRDTRVWRIESLGGQRYQGKAADVVGLAKGEVQGNTLHWQYTLRAPRGNSTIDLTLDDWLYLQPNNILINQTTFTKFGFEVGQLNIMFQKQASVADCGPPQVTSWQANTSEPLPQ